MSSTIKKHQYSDVLRTLSTEQQHWLAKKVAKLGPENTTKKSRLIACITTFNDDYPDIADIRRHLQDNMPDYFVPQDILPVLDIPRQAQGKIERKELIEHPWQFITETLNRENSDVETGLSEDTGFVPPGTEVERILADIWCDVLGIGEISVHDKFIEVGGDSLLSIRILSRIKSAGFDVNTEAFFEFPTIYQQAQWLSQSQAAESGREDEQQVSVLPQLAQSELNTIAGLLDEVDDD